MIGKVLKTSKSEEKDTLREVACIILCNNRKRIASARDSEDYPEVRFLYNHVRRMMDSIKIESEL